MLRFNRAELAHERVVLGVGDVWVIEDVIVIVGLLDLMAKPIDSDSEVLGLVNHSNSLSTKLIGRWGSGREYSRVEAGERRVKRALPAPEQNTTDRPATGRYALSAAH